VHWFNLDQSGQASTGVSSISNFTHWYTLSKTNLLSLLEALGNLPEPPKGKLPYERQIMISGIRSNEWFRAIYDRAAIPKEVATVFEREGLTWRPTFISVHDGPNNCMQRTQRSRFVFMVNVHWRRVAGAFREPRMRLVYHIPLLVFLAGCSAQQGQVDFASPPVFKVPFGEHRALMFYSDSTVLRMGGSYYTLAVPLWLLAAVAFACIAFLVWMFYRRKRRE